MSASGSQLSFDLSLGGPFVPEHWLELGSRRLQVHVVRSEKARRYVLSLRSDFSVRLVIPRRGSVVEGKRFLDGKKRWIERQVRKLEAVPFLPKAWTSGTVLLLRGREEILEVRVDCLALGGETFPIRRAPENLRPLVEGWLRKLAQDELPRIVSNLAEKHRIDVHRVSVRDQSTRWGSCSAKGTISLNWRLVQVPQEVRDYLVIHELMHRREMNHSPAYWRLVEGACPDYRVHERWLKMNGARLGL